MNDEDYVVIAVDGDFREFMEADTDFLKFEGLSWEEVISISKLSFRQGYQVVIWPTNGENGGEA